MQWQGHPDYLLFFYAHGFSLGQISSLHLVGAAGRFALDVPLSNSAFAVAGPSTSDLPEGDYDVDAASVNGVQRIGQMRLTRSCALLTVLESPAAGQPYSICVLPNNSLQSPNGSINQDVILTDTAKFNAALIDVLRSLLFSAEDLLCAAYAEGILRLTVVVSNVVGKFKKPFVAEAEPNLAKPIQKNIQAFLRGAKIDCDVALVVHGSKDYTRASAKFTVDDPTSDQTAFQIDDRTFHHHRKTKTPGAATISYYSFDISHTPLHELGHAAAEINNGQVIDLYHDQLSSGPLVLNKKLGRPVPHSFAKYNGSSYASDLTRDHVGYPSEWKSYHPELISYDEPNLMDDYWLAQGDPLNCRFDRLTRDWLFGRFRAKARI